MDTKTKEEFQLLQKKIEILLKRNPDLLPVDSTILGAKLSSMHRHVDFLLNLPATTTNKE